MALRGARMPNIFDGTKKPYEGILGFANSIAKQVTRRVA